MSVKQKKYIGIDYFGHDSSLSIIDIKNKNIFAMSTERVTRIKHDDIGIDPILKEYGKILDNTDIYINEGFEKQLDWVFDMDFRQELRKAIAPTYISDLKCVNKKLLILPLGFKHYIKDKIKNNVYRILTKFNLIKKQDLVKKKIISSFNKYTHDTTIKSVKFTDHHLAHCLSSYYFSPFAYSNNAITLTMDGYGDGYFTKIFSFSKNGQYELVGGSKYINRGSIGIVYKLFTVAMSLTPNSDEGKVEALAAYAKADDSFLQKLLSMIQINDLVITFESNQLKKLNDREYLKAYRNKLGDKVFCATVQTWLEKVMVDYLNQIHDKFKIDNLCLSGGVTANVIMNLNIYEKTPFKNIFIAPFMTDEGVSMGSAIKAALDENEDLSWLKERYMPYYGDSYNKEEVLVELKKHTNIIYEDLNNCWHKQAANSIVSGKIIALFHNKMEFGPRALGNRSILANPFDTVVRDKINSSIKRRPYYQPFCPSILEEDREELFQKSFSHKHMATAFRVKEKYREFMFSGTHIDGTARAQFVTSEDNAEYHKLLTEIKKLKGFGVVINTSFNLHGRTIVRTPNDAIKDFIDCNIDELYIEGFKVTKCY